MFWGGTEASTSYHENSVPLLLGNSSLVSYVKCVGSDSSSSATTRYGNITIYHTQSDGSLTTQATTQRCRMMGILNSDNSDSESMFSAKNDWGYVDLNSDGYPDFHTRSTLEDICPSAHHLDFGRDTLGQVGVWMGSASPSSELFFGTSDGIQELNGVNGHVLHAIQGSENVVQSLLLGTQGAKSTSMTIADVDLDGSSLKIMKHRLKARPSLR